ncbi:uncharacterized protein LOC131294776 [Anopheles ziemanni]|uniref:uncharacterized protein LOC131265355 n=1 Tax=Anopheles coustani TaxID=139045 RepID=UPI00265AD732|nr:uncharacterized protein LOC131265355 [Anopheles coustani]XP_058178803.1 uncharacterized protein LOC131294776 [Anopheles ziemanni]
MMVDNFECAGYTFYSKFDSGNLGKVELVRCCEGLGIVGNTVSSATGGNASANIAGVPVITTGGSTNGGQQSIVPTTNTTSASAIVAATLGVGVALSTTTATTAGSGTLGLPIPSPTPYATENPLVEVEFNLWTRPDCAGTAYENQNRTWFHFAVTGGRPNQIVKFNVMNLNKQAKLFSQGMHPVTKVGPNGRWERIKDKPSYSITNDVFYISFLHKAPEVATDQTKIYYAFTFPFTYTELLDQLATFDRKYGRHPFELNKMAYDISQKYDTSTSSGNSSSGPGGEESKGISNLSHRRKKGRLSKMERVDRTSDPESFDETARDGTAVAGDDDISGRKPSVAPPTKEVLSEVAKTLQATLGTAGGSMVIDDNTSESMQAITNLVNNVKIELPAGGQKPQLLASSMTSSKLKLPSFHNHLTVASGTGTSSTIAPTIDDDSKSDTRDEIYYCRELLTHSVERRRIELLTISSFHGIQTAREVRLRNLFPDEDAQRCHTFRDKKIVFISSRVHPGETPASFVLNGFLSMLLDRKSVISQTLRRMYVFKIIPFLNPDGVYNGLYRSDTRGHNLNRVYIAPCHETQPAIYAARKLIRYYHLGVDEIEPYELEKVEKKNPLPQATVEGSPGLQDAVTSEGTTTTAPVSVEANPPLKKGRQPLQSSVAKIARRNSTNSHLSSTATNNSNTHNLKTKLPKLLTSNNNSPLDTSSGACSPQPVPSVKRLVSSLSVPSPAPPPSEESAMSRKRRTLTPQSTDNNSCSSSTSVSVAGERRSIIAFTTPSPVTRRELVASSTSSSSWSDKLLGKILRRRRSSKGDRMAAASATPSTRLSPIAQALPKPTLLLPSVGEEKEEESVGSHEASSNSTSTLAAAVAEKINSTNMTSGSTPLTDESDSVEQDTPAASDSGFSEASTASSKVVTMSSISSAGSTPPENDGKTASVGEVGSLVGALSPPQPPSLAVAAATAVAAGAAAGGGGGKVFTDKLIPELNPIVVGETAVRPMGGAGRSASSTSLISSGSLSGAGGGKKSIHSVQAKVDSGKGGSKGGGKQHVALNKPQFIGSTPAGTLKLKEFLLHPHHHHHHHHHHHPHHHHHHHQTVPAGGLVAGSGSVAGGGSVQGQAVLHGGKMSLGGLKKATAGHKKDASSSASSSARAPTGSSILGEATPGGGKNLRPQTPQTQPQFSHYRSHRNEYLGSSVGIGAGVGAGTGASQRNLNISLDFLAQLDERNDRVVYEDRSNLFMYIDLHGHASKKGVFMYGNHLPSTVEAVECMLLPRLMSLNSQHFHFDACNFSERNMYYKGKRDGLSKEGSGRVAVYKSTGLIKSYTLECNYNTGKCVNILPPRGKEIVAKTTHTLVPPKYVPAVFEEVGKALGPSILDLTNSNPLSRLPNCEFRTLQGLRNALRIEIERGSSKARVTNKAQKSHSKRHASQLSSSMMIEISKENQAIQWEHPVGGSGGGGGGVGGSGSVIGAVGSSVAVAVAVGAGGVASGGGGGAGNNTVCKVVGDPDPSNPPGHHGSVSMPVSGGVVIGGSVAVAGGSGRQFLKGTSVVTLKAAHGAGGGKISRKGAGGFVKKKQKVLCDVGSVGSLVTTGGGGIAGGKKMQELQVLRSTKEQTVPRKKIKVSPQTIVDRSSGLELCFKGGLGVGSLPNFLTAVPAGLGELPLAGSGAKKVSKSESKLLDMVVVNDLMQCDDSFDAAPCCSYSSTSGAIVTTTSGAISKLISTYTQAENASGSGTGEIPTSLIGGGGGIPIDTSGTGMLECNAIGGSSSGESSSSLKFGKASLKPKQKTKLAKSTKSSGADTGKKLLKKKRSLKTDTNLKRKKTRVKPALT